MSAHFEPSVPFKADATRSYLRKSIANHGSVSYAAMRSALPGAWTHGPQTMAGNRSRPSSVRGWTKGKDRVRRDAALPTSSLRCAGVAHHLPEVVEAAGCGAEATAEAIGEAQQRPVLVDLAEVCHGVAGDVVAECPSTRRGVSARGAEERVEVRGYAVVGGGWLDAAGTGAPVAAVDGADVRRLDARQIGLEGYAFVVEVETSTCAGAREHDRRRVIRIAVRPDVQIGRSVESGVRIQTARDLYQQGCRRIQAEVVIRVRLLDVVGRSLGAGASAACGDVAAVVEVPDLVRESDVVRVRRPGHAGLLRAGAVLRMEVVRQVLADGAVRLVLDLAEAVRRAGDHKA